MFSSYGMSAYDNVWDMMGGEVSDEMSYEKDRYSSTVDNPSSEKFFATNSSESESHREASTDTTLAIKDGDQVNIDYVGTIDGVPALKSAFEVVRIAARQMLLPAAAAITATMTAAAAMPAIFAVRLCRRSRATSFLRSSRFALLLLISGVSFLFSLSLFSLLIFLCLKIYQLIVNPDRHGIYIFIICGLNDRRLKKRGFSLL